MLADDVAVDAGMERALRRHESAVDAALRGKDLLDTWFVAAGEGTGRDELLGHRRGGLRGADTLESAALQDRAVEEIAPSGEQGRYRDRTGGLPRHRDGAGVTAESADLLAHPLQRLSLVAQCQVGGAGPVPVRCVERTQRTEPEVHRHHHDVAAPGESRTVEERGGSVTLRLPTAVQEDQHGSLVVVGRRRPNVERETVLAHRQAALGEPLGRDVLRGNRTERDRVAHTCPARCRLRWAPTKLAHRRRGVRHTAKDENVPTRVPAQCSVGGVRHCGQGRSVRG